MSGALTPDVSNAERADVKRWFERIEGARKYDEKAREQYARDRRYARGDSGFEVDANLIGTYIDLTESFLYAKNPDVDVLPAKATEPPEIEAMREAAESMPPEPEVEMGGQIAAQTAMSQGVDPLAAQMAGEQAKAAIAAELMQKRFKEIRDRFRKRQRDNKAFAETVELVIARLWVDAGLKAKARRWLRSVLTTGLGVMKASWQERKGQDPQIMGQIADL
ncbi:MAG: hypothetical protein ABIW84_07345, partial [Ilumatobacteraceae bacterium]